jgi:hypothetical protein
MPPCCPRSSLAYQCGQQKYCTVVSGMSANRASFRQCHVATARKCRRLCLGVWMRFDALFTKPEQVLPAKANHAQVGLAQLTQPASVLKGIGRAYLGITPNVFVQRGIVITTVGVRPNRVIRRYAIKQIVDLAIEFPMLDAGVGERQIELAVRRRIEARLGPNAGRSPALDTGRMPYEVRLWRVLYKDIRSSRHPCMFRNRGSINCPLLTSRPVNYPSPVA